MTPLQEFQRLSKYARWNKDDGRRETWRETTTRYVDQLKHIANGRLFAEEFEEIESAMLSMDVLGSMRLIAMAGDAFERDNVTAYNCAALPVDDFTSFHDATIISMSGGGVTYSVEHRFIDKLPKVKPQSDEWKNMLIPDSTEGWALAIHYAVILAYEGFNATFDYSQIRPAGALLKTKGGRASGPQPLKDAIEAITVIIRNAQGRKLRPLELSDIFCHIGNASVCGGVRRTAMMALFDYGDAEMRQAKSGEWWKVAPVRSNANFSEVWPTESRLSYQEVSDALDAMFYGDSGEPGFFNRRAAIAKMPLRRMSQLDEHTIQNILVNPCGEAILIPRELCNLSVVVARPYDTEESLLLKAMIASRIGTIQAAATNFTTLLDPRWKDNCEWERLLGVGVTGWMDSQVSRNPETMRAMLKIIYDENKETAQALGIGQATALTAVKPAGNTGLLADVASGIHARHYPYMLRRVTLNDHEPIFEVLRESNVPLEKSEWKEGQWYAQFPLAAPIGAITQDRLSAIEQLNFTRKVMRNYVEHSVSVTISYEPGEEEAIKRYIHTHQEDFIGLSFFRKDRKFNQAPIEQITEAEYNRRVSEFPVIRWELLNEMEQEDYTQAASEIACGNGKCEIGDAVPLTFEVK